jgi:Vacuolar sorting 38 and autophagy-related subunit 14
VKTDVATRKSNLASAIKAIKANHMSSSTSLKAEISRVGEKRENIHMNIAIARRSRCKEAADLLGLRRLSNKDDTFLLAGIILVDLNLIRSTSSFNYTNQLDYPPMYVLLQLLHTTHLLTLLTDYLSLKLPYEIIPPSRGTSYPSIRKSTIKSLPLHLFTETSPQKAWAGKKLKDLPNLENLVEAISLLAWDISWVLWTQQLWPPIPTTNEALETCHIARNLYHLVNSPKIGRNSHSSTMAFIPSLERSGTLPPFNVGVKDVQDVISLALEQNGEGDGGGWDMVEGGEEVLRGDGWLKLNTVTHSE